MHLKTFARHGALALAALAASACEAPEGLKATRPIEPFLSGVTVGVTANGEGRARLSITNDLYLGVVGSRAYLSTDDGATFPERQPLRRYSNEPAHHMLVDLDPGVTYTVQLVAVSNIGVESLPNTEGPLAVVVPAAKSDELAPVAAEMNRIENHGDAVSIRWFQQTTDADVFGYVVERSVDGGAFEAVSEVLQDSVAPHFRDTSATAPGVYAYRVVVEDLSGNRGEPSLPLDITIE